MLLLHKNVVPNHALRNLIAEVRGVRRPITLEEHVAAATPCCPEELDDSQDSTATATAPTSDGSAPEATPVVALGGAPRRDDETAAAPAHAAEAKQPIEPCAALCVQSAVAACGLACWQEGSPLGNGQGAQAEQKQLVAANPELAAQPTKVATCLCTMPPPRACPGGRSLCTSVLDGLGGRTRQAASR